jgi:septal ring factor EnvC (AmiA/AmiB activator)
MEINYLSILIAISAALVSGMGTAMIASFRDNKKEKRRQVERDQDLLKMDLKDLKIELYKIEKELTEWKDKYYAAIQELIGIKAELEATLIELGHFEHHLDELDR